MAPETMQTILSVSSESLDNLAKMAAKISEVCTATDTNVFAIGQAVVVFADSTQRVSPLDEVAAL